MFDLRNLKALPPFTSNGLHVRTTNEWSASANGGTGQGAAKEYARANGWSALIWDDGHVSLYVSDGYGVERIRFYPQSAQVDTAEEAEKVTA